MLVYYFVPFIVSNRYLLFNTPKYFPYFIYVVLKINMSTASGDRSLVCCLAEQNGPS